MEDALRVSPAEGEELATREILEGLIQKDIGAFSEFFIKDLKNNPPTRFELAFLKTYLYWKLEKFDSSAKKKGQPRDSC